MVENPTLAAVPAASASSAGSPAIDRRMGALCGAPRRGIGLVRRTIPKACSASSMQSCSARGGSSSIPASTPSAGRASRRSTTASKPSEIERYVVNPGQACAYMIGQLKILELRDRARAHLKDRFSERAFHNAVLGPGSVPARSARAGGRSIHGQMNGSCAGPSRYN